MSVSRKLESQVIDPDRFRVAILIVSFRNPQDVQTCLTALSRSTEEPGFDIFVCENGGRESFRELCVTLMGSQGPCIPVSDGLPDSLVSPSGRLVEVKCFALKDRRPGVWIGCGEPVNAPIDLQEIEAALDCIAGGSMYITRACLEKIGLMDERFFLLYEDADWSIRAKKHGVGYARNSIVPHRGGTTIGSARLRAERSRLSVYLESRNHLHFVRMHWQRYLPVAILLGCVDATTYLFALSPKNFKAAVDGLLAGMKGETGMPKFHD